MNPLVSVVIVNHNGRTFLNEALHSLEKTDYEPFEVVVVDNGSTDGSVEAAARIAEAWPALRLVRNDFNAGPARARNQGIAIARGELVAFLDNDTTVEPSWLAHAVRVFVEDASVGAVQCKLLLKRPPGRLDCVGEWIGQNGFLVPVAVSGEEDDCGQHDGVGEILAAKSAGMVARTDALRDVGGFDEDFFIYVEETDLCWRIWLRGHRVVLAPRSVVHHHFGTSTVILGAKANMLVKYHGPKNYVATLVKNAGGRTLARMLPAHLAAWQAVALIHLAKGQFRSAWWIQKGLAWNLRHLRRLLRKRRTVQAGRCMTDADLLARVLKPRPIGYFYEKLARRKAVGNTQGWDKGE